ncbi:hypothetical protein [Streptomyces sp. NPDC058757]|uniref:hypothetical protein n=1 Tax=Streptomyces sp. NPDC058757 TaxID=3346626 RepID=UPI0036A57604
MSGDSISIALKEKGWRDASSVAEILGFLDLIAPFHGWMVRLTENPSAGLVLVTMTRFSAEPEEPIYLWVDLPEENREQAFCDVFDGLRGRSDLDPGVIVEGLRVEGFSVHEEYPN